MIKKPSEMDFGEEKFSVILYGAPGVGKSTLASSAPNPIMFDLDRGLRRVKAQHRPPASFVNTYEELLEDMKSEEARQFDSYIIDTGGALVTMILDYVGRQDPVNRQKNGAPSQKGYGAAKIEFKRLTDMLKYELRKNVIYVFHSVEEKDKNGSPIQRLLCDGSAKNIVWQPCDFGGYMYKNGNQTEVGFTPTDEYFAKGCYGINGVRIVPFGEKIPNNFLTYLFAEANKNITADKEYFEEENKKYAETMKAGTEFIAGIKTAEDIAAVGAKIKGLPQYLTSLVELRQLYKDKIKEEGFTWNSEKKRYEKRAEPVEQPSQGAKGAVDGGTPAEDKQGLQATENVADGGAAEQQSLLTEQSSRKGRKE